MFEYKLKTWYNSFWAWLKNSGTILNARITAFTGFVIAVIGALDWSPLLSLFGTSTAFDWKQVTSLGAIMFVKGIIDEVVRRYNTVTINAKLIPQDVVAISGDKAVIDLTPPEVTG